jgi:hypothetical protein
MLVEESPSCLDHAADPVAQYQSEGDWAGGVRPANVIESTKDIDWLFEPNNRDQTGRVRLVCRYCGSDRAVRSQSEGLNWFTRHACEGEGVDIETWLAA